MNREERDSREGGGKTEQDGREIYMTGGKMKGRRGVRVGMTKGKSKTGMTTRRKEAGRKGKEKVAWEESTAR